MDPNSWPLVRSLQQEFQFEHQAGMLHFQAGNRLFQFFALRGLHAALFRQGGASPSILQYRTGHRRREPAATAAADPR